jgi:hypothetical protein
MRMKKPQPCTGNFTRIMGLPCIHQCLQKEQTKSSFGLDDFDPQWHWDQLGIQLSHKDLPETQLSDSELLDHQLLDRQLLDHQLLDEDLLMDQLINEPIPELEDEFVLEPLKVKGKGGPKTPRTRRTGRILSGFEVTESQVRIARRRCTVCNETGHN